MKIDHPSGWWRSGPETKRRLRSSTWVAYLGDHKDHTEMSLITCAMLDARRAFKAATFESDMGKTVKAELDYEATQGELLAMLHVVVLKPDQQPFTDEEANEAVACCRQWIDRQLHDEREEYGED